jgi:hypothetical protein
LTNMVTAQLPKFATLNRHQLAGHVANLDFWLAEARHCLDVIDRYRPRFERLKAAQAAHVAKHRTIEFEPGEPYIRGRASQPRSVPDHELKESRRPVRDAAYRFLARCYNEELIDDETFRRECQGLKLNIERKRGT